MLNQRKLYCLYILSKYYLLIGISEGMNEMNICKRLLLQLRLKLRLRKA